MDLVSVLQNASSPSKITDLNPHVFYQITYQNLTFSQIAVTVLSRVLSFVYVSLEHCLKYCQNFNRSANS
jgi:hypothetical protein